MEANDDDKQRDDERQGDPYSRGIGVLRLPHRPGGADMQLKGDRIAAYARYSSDRQSESSVDDQLRRIRSFASARGKRSTNVSSSATMQSRRQHGAPRLRSADGEVKAARNRRSARRGHVALVTRQRRRTQPLQAARLLRRAARRDLRWHRLSSKGAKLAYSVKALMSDLYLEDLRDKTLRGMEGRALAGKAVGRSRARLSQRPGNGARWSDPGALRDRNRARGRRDRSAHLRAVPEWPLVLRHRDGAEQGRHPVAARTHRHERKSGWTDGTVRAILYNERYTGVLVFNERRWVKVPGTNKRIPQKKDPSEVIRVRRDDLRHRRPGAVGRGSGAAWRCPRPVHGERGRHAQGSRARRH